MVADAIKVLKVVPVVDGDDLIIAIVAVDVGIVCVDDVVLVDDELVVVVSLLVVKLEVRHVDPVYPPMHEQLNAFGNCCT